MTVEPVGVRGFDTETFRGRVKLLASSDGQFTEESETEALLTWLWTHGKTTHNVFWNVGYDFQCVMKPWIVDHGFELKHLWVTRLHQRRRMKELQAKNERTEMEAQELHKLHQAHPEQSVVANFDVNDEMRVRYIHGKGFTITLGDVGKGAGVSFYDASAFYRPDHANIKLDTAAKQYLNKGKNDAELGVSAKMIGNVPGYYEKNRDRIIPYCVQDALLCAELQALTIQSHKELNLPWPQHPWSKASVHKEYWKGVDALKDEIRNYRKLFKQSPWKAFWSEAYHGGIFVVRHLGRFEEGYDIDINSAYPWRMTLMQSLLGADGVNLASPRFDSAPYKFLRIKVQPTPRLLDPTDKDGLLRYHYAIEPRTLVVTGHDLETLDLYGDKYEILEGIGFIPRPDAAFPFAYLNEVFEKKAEVKNEYGKKSVRYNNIKVFANSGSGALAQRHPAESKWTNLIFASHITAAIRQSIWALVHEVEQSGDTLISVKTDGITVSGTHARSEFLSRSTEDLGGIDVEKVRGGVSFENGVYLVDDAEGKPTFRHRGLKPNVKVHKPNSACAFSGTECDCPSVSLRAALETCQTPTLSVDREMPLSMVRAIIQGRTQDIAIFEPDTHTLFPARAASRCFDVPEHLFHRPLADYFRDGWTLEWAHHA